jgi:hypothetical protein
VAGITPNQILAFEDMDGFEGGDSHYVPANFARVDDSGDLQMPASLATAVAELVGVKGHNGGPVNIGRVLSGKNEELIRGAHDDLGTVLAQLAEQPEEQNAETPARSRPLCGARGAQPRAGDLVARLCADQRRGR